ncbi:MAG: carboxypeptidase-like regulatory domain-containing protein, partial [Bacteroidales bacterium]
MARRWVCVVCMLFVGCAAISAYTYSGRVTDKRKNPLPGVAVFLNRTTICSVTGEDGTFRIEAPMMFESALVFAKEGFITEVIANPYEEAEKEKIGVILNPKVPSEEITERYGRFIRDFFLAEFRANFSGRDSAGLSCVIENEEALVFQYDSALHFVSVAMKRPLQIRNPYLGYRIVAYIENYFFTPLTPLKKERMPFWLRETYSSLRPENVADRPNSFYGFFYFIDEVGSNPLYAQRRLLQDEGSQLHFFRTVR